MSLLSSRGRRCLGIALLGLFAGTSWCVAEESLETRFDPASAYRSIQSKELMEHIQFLASDQLEGRDSGSRGELAAARYLARQFGRYGLRPVGDQGTYFQHFGFEATRTVGAGSLVRFAVGDETIRVDPQTGFTPFGFSASREVSGKLVFAGYGVTSKAPAYDDYSGIDVKGKIVLLLRYVPQSKDKNGAFSPSRRNRHAFFINKARNAQAHGALGVIVVTGPVHQDQEKKDPLAGTIGNEAGIDIPVVHMKRSVAEKLFRFSGRDLQKIQTEVDESLIPQSFELKGIEASLDVQVERAQVRTRNVAGFLEGSDPKLREEVLVIGGHFDHVGYGHYGSRQGHRGKIHNGADDNASGTSAILELAEAFSRLETAPRRSILFLLFSGEERGLLGSKYYVDHPLIPLKKTVAMINLDMVGRGKGDAFTVFGTGTSPSFESLLKGINARTEHAVKYRAEGTGPSDHSSFYHKGVPVLFFHTGLHPDYHTPADDWNKINAHGCEVVTRFIYLTAYYLTVVSDERPEFRKSEAPRKKRVMLGVRPGDSVGKDEGFRIGEIVKGSAAEKAGLRKGDLIFRIGSAKIRNFEDLAHAIGKLKIGQKVPVEIQRAGESKIISVTLGSSK